MFPHSAVDLWQTFEVDSLEHLEALEVVTARLEDRLNLCKANVMMVTSFDAATRRRHKKRRRKASEQRALKGIWSQRGLKPDYVKVEGRERSPSPQIYFWTVHSIKTPRTLRSMQIGTAREHVLEFKIVVILKWPLWVIISHATDMQVLYSNKILAQKGFLTKKNTLHKIFKARSSKSCSI